MKRLITVRADDKVRLISEQTLPLIRHYANKWGAEVMVLDHTPLVLADDGGPHYRILKLGLLLNHWDRILNLDVDTLIMPSCPNPFEEIPSFTVGVTFEDMGTRTEDRQHRMRAACEFYGGPVDWTGVGTPGYPNSGVLMVSPEHQVLFEPGPEGRYYTSHGSDDVHIGYQLHRHKTVSLAILEPAWNHMILHSEMGLNRFDARIIHYAGTGVFDEGVPDRVEQIRRDIKRVYG